MRRQVAIIGMGNIGKGIAERVFGDPDAELVGVSDADPELVGKDVGSVIGGERAGIPIEHDFASVLEATEPDITLVATVRFLKQISSQIEAALAVGSNVISPGAEVLYPEKILSNHFDHLDGVAKKNDASIIGAGINPGFVVDRLVAVLSGVCNSISHIEATRTADLSQYSEYAERYGIGLSPDEFIQKWSGDNKDSLAGATIDVSGYLIEDACGISFEELRKSHRPIVADETFSTHASEVLQGQVQGWEHKLTGIHNDAEVMSLKIRLGLFPNASQDRITISGNPSFQTTIEPSIPSQTGTVNYIYNILPLLEDAPAGFITLNDIASPTYTWKR